MMGKSQEGTTFISLKHIARLFVRMQIRDAASIQKNFLCPQQWCILPDFVYFYYIAMENDISKTHLI